MLYVGLNWYTDVLPLLQRNKCIDSIKETIRAISRKNIANVCFIENYNLPTFWEIKLFLILMSSTFWLIVAKVLKLQERNTPILKALELRISKIAIS